MSDLEKASESANHENSLLRAQVDRLQVELKDYRRRLHQARETPALPGASGLFGAKNPSSGGFQFEFPMFGGGLFGRQTAAGGVKTGSSTLLERLNAGQGGIPAPVGEDKKKLPISSDDDGFSSKLSLGTGTSISSSILDVFDKSVIDSVNKKLLHQIMASATTKTVTTTHQEVCKIPLA